VINADGCRGRTWDTAALLRDLEVLDFATHFVVVRGKAPRTPSQFPAGTKRELRMTADTRGMTRISPQMEAADEEEMACRNHPGVAARPDSPLPLCTCCLQDWARARRLNRSFEHRERSSRASLGHWMTRTDALLDELGARRSGGRSGRGRAA
jgi:hypothetical protein